MIRKNAYGNRGCLRAMLCVWLGACFFACAPAVSMEDAGAEAGAPSCNQTRPAWGRGGEYMLPGSDCASCHRESGQARSSFSIAGTVFASQTCLVGVSEATLQITDSTGTTAELRSNEEGNFFSNTALRPPYRVSVRVGGVVRTMQNPAPHGSCGACHVPSSFRYLTGSE